MARMDFPENKVLLVRTAKMVKMVNPDEMGYQAETVLMARTVETDFQVSKDLKAKPEHKEFKAFQVKMEKTVSPEQLVQLALKAPQVRKVWQDPLV
jgi:hypothetical protein